jgi:hypothetical protein
VVIATIVVIVAAAVVAVVVVAAYCSMCELILPIVRSYTRPCCAERKE